MAATGGVCSPHVLIGLVSRGGNKRIHVGMLVAPGEVMENQPFVRGKATDGGLRS